MFFPNQRRLKLKPFNYTKITQIGKILKKKMLIVNVLAKEFKVISNDHICVQYLNDLRHYLTHQADSDAAEFGMNRQVINNIWT